MESSSLSSKQRDRIKIVKSIVQFFDIDLSIKLFGVEIVHFHWPPKSFNS